MAVISTPLATTLRLQVQTGTDATGQPVYRVRSYSRVKPSASDQDVYDVAQAIGSLQVHPVNAVSRVNENDLSAGA
ncbi:Protein of unknown function DUF1659 [Moorella glycerini]|uniref:DUF1659 domain-containing protein n=2 Tax=Neomoorella TaxID=44260 RepID=A0A9X7J6A9_9FIRM|nr:MULTISPECIES: DUF1659 domain-containing protein [Moorella]PRR77064.1 hypothetical protein MOST_03600 [Moorella stamsii]GEA16551.1 hypothetical protein E308F_27970 [Moorella sp. E308F]CEP68839.1 Protein of unknown function DUF1659 [Moorella glycerini]